MPEETNLDVIRGKLISAEAAAGKVKSGDMVVVPTGREPAAICYPLAARVGELENVRVSVGLAGRDFGWYDEGWQGAFQIEAPYVLPMLVEGMAQRRLDFTVHDALMRSYFDVAQAIDVLILSVSYPDKHGYCSFGGSVWFKKEQARYAKLVLAELVPNTIRTYGENYIHWSEIDYFVDHVPLEGGTLSHGGMRGSPANALGEVERQITAHIAGLIRDGDTIQVGVGRSTERLAELGCFAGKNDLGIHSEMIPGSLIKLVQGGVFTGARKSIHRGRAVATGVAGRREEYAIADMNPAFELYGANYIHHPAVIAQNDNLVAINSAFAVDIYGQILADSLGFHMVAGVGGQLPFAIGAQMSKGGRYIVALPSRAENGQSRIVFTAPAGTVVSVSRNLADYVVTEYGVASLRGASQRRRAEALVALAHPEVRPELARQMRAAFWSLPPAQTN